LGVPLAENKTEGLTTKIIFLGLEIDTVLMKVKIPEDKLNKLRLGMQYILEHKKMKFKELESIVGLMAFYARAIPSARAVIRRFYDLISEVRVKKSYDYVRINQEIKSDAEVWLEFLKNFNGGMSFLLIITRAWLSIFNKIFRFWNLTPQMNIAINTGTSSKNDRSDINA
jgi:hypothetical protein